LNTSSFSSAVAVFVWLLPRNWPRLVLYYFARYVEERRPKRPGKTAKTKFRCMMAKSVGSSIVLYCEKDETDSPIIRCRNGLDIGLYSKAAAFQLALISFSKWLTITCYFMTAAHDMVHFRAFLP
jgi:hypothetical protein